MYLYEKNMRMRKNNHLNLFWHFHFSSLPDTGCLFLKNKNTRIYVFFKKKYIYTYIYIYKKKICVQQKKSIVVLLAFLLVEPPWHSFPFFFVNIYTFEYICFKIYVLENGCIHVKNSTYLQPKI